jgi:low affinity Fe/Cu permease
MTHWTIRLREVCFWVVEFSVAAALIIAFATAVKYGLWLQEFVGRGWRMSAKLDTYLTYEAECLRHAERAVDDATRRTLQSLAQRWRQLAERTNGSDERSRRP